MCTFLHVYIKSKLFYILYVRYVAVATSPLDGPYVRNSSLGKADRKLTEYLTILNILTFPYFSCHPPGGASAAASRVSSADWFSWFDFVSLTERIGGKKEEVYFCGVQLFMNLPGTYYIQ